MWKLIGSGYEGDVFISADKKLIKKVFHIPNDAKLPDYRFSVWREIEFSNIASQYPQFFMQLVSYQIVDKCNYKRKTPMWLKLPKEISEWKETQDTNLCAELIYTPVLDGTLRSLYQSYNIRDEKSHIQQWNKFTFPLLFQQLYILYILETLDYVHRDAHHANWMYKKISTSKPLIFSGLKKTYKLKTNYQLFLCDYGELTHKKHPNGPTEGPKYNWDYERYRDIMLNIFGSIFAPMKYNIEKFPPNGKLIKKLAKYPESKNISLKKISKLYKEDMFIIMFSLQYPHIYWKEVGYKGKVYQYDDDTISIYKFLFDNMEKPMIILDYLMTII